MTLPGRPDQGEPARSLTFRLTRDDLAYVERLPRPLPDRARSLLVLAWLTLCALMGVFSDLLEPVFGWAAPFQPYAWVLASGALVWGVGELIDAILTARGVRNAREPQTDTQVDIAEDHIAITQDHVSHAFLWTDVLDARLREDRILVTLTAPGETRRILTLPLRAFADAADMRACWELLDTLIRLADGDATNSEDGDD